MRSCMTLMAALALQAPAPQSQPANAPPDTVREFLLAAEALMAKGAEGMGTPEGEAVRQAVQDAARAYRAALAESASRNEAPSSCPPPAGQAQLTIPALIGDFQAFPDANRDMPVAMAFALVMTLRYPCRGVRQ